LLRLNGKLTVYSKEAVKKNRLNPINPAVMQAQYSFGSDSDEDEELDDILESQKDRVASYQLHDIEKVKLCS
jgi:hypothetical protein